MLIRQVFLAMMMAISTSATAQNHKIQSLFTQRHEIDERYDACPDAEATRVLAPFTPAVDSLQMPMLGYNEEEMWVSRPECPLGNWTADMLLAEAKTMGIDVQVAVTNIGGLRASMPKGDVRLSHIFEIAPFDNRLCILQLKGSTMLQLCREIAGNGGEGISGMAITMTQDGQLLEATIAGERIDTARIYSVATLDYLSEGNDHLTAFRLATGKHVYERPVRDIYIDAIKREAAAGHTLRATVEGRVTVAGNGGHKAPAYEACPTLTILHTSDTHSQILPISANVTNKEVAGKGGYVRRATFLKQQREQDPELLLTDAGDFSQGTLFYNLYSGETEIQLMNCMGYDVATIGNHEFDNGLENLARLIRMARFPFVCANYDFSGTPCDGLVKPYVTLHRHGLKIGVFGLGCKLEGIVAEKNRAGVRFTPPALVADSVVQVLRDEEHCDVVICLTHIGWLEEAMDDKDLIAHSHGIDVVLGGHSHTFMTKAEYVNDSTGQPVPCLHTGKSGCYVGEVKMNLKEIQQ